METPKNKQQKRKIAGWAVTLGVHAVIAVLLLIFGFVTPLPLPEPEGISVDLGVPDAGGPDHSASESTPTTASTSQSQQGAEATETSDNPALPDDATSQTNSPNITPPDNKISDELEEYKKKMAEIAANAKKKAEEGKGEGKGKIPGDDGQPDGTEGADKGGGTGFGDAAGLGGGRYLEKTPIIKEQKQQTGFIEVEVLVNKDGKVIDARVNLKAGSKTTITDTYLHDKVIRAVREQARYTPTLTGPDVQKTKYIFEFKLN